MSNQRNDKIVIYAENHSVAEKMAMRINELRVNRPELFHTDKIIPILPKKYGVLGIGNKRRGEYAKTPVGDATGDPYNDYLIINKELYQKFFMTTEEIQACRDGYIYVHDMSARRDTMNCCLFDVQNVLSGGFGMGNIWYNEPKTLDTAFDVIGDIVLSAASQQYGGFTVPSVDLILEPYAEKSYNRNIEKYIDVDKYLRARRSLAFFKMVAAKRAGDDAYAEQLYATFAEEINAEDLTDEEKQKAMALLNSDIAYYGKYSE